MQKLTTSYSMYYNHKYKRTGSLFEGKFKSIHINDDRYMKYLFSYIHLNPIKLIQPDWKEKGIKNKDKAFDYIKNYKHSSLIDYFEDREEGIILDKKLFPKYFPTINLMKKELLSWITYKVLGKT